MRRAAIACRAPLAQLPAPILALALASSAALLSCGSKPPEVAAVDWRLETRTDEKGSSYESLTAFGSVKDEDGADNIDAVWIENEGSALAWKLTSADWTRKQEGSDEWMGGSSLAMPDLGPLPRGAYRFIAIDAAGQRAELPFTVDAKAPDRRPPFASVSVTGEGESLSVSSDWPETLVLAFDAAGLLLATAAAPKASTPLAALFGRDTAGRIALIGAYGYDPDIRVGSFSARTKIR